MPAASDTSSDCDSGKDDFSDWASSLHGANRTKSLFDDSLLDSPEETVEYDGRIHGWNLSERSSELGLTDYQRIMLVNYIRRNSIAATQLANLSVHDPIFQDNNNLKPEIENDPLLQLSFDDSWSDDEQAVPLAMHLHGSSSDSPTTNACNEPPAEQTAHSLNISQTEALRAELAQERLKVKTLQALIARDLEGDLETSSSESSGSESSVDGKGKGRATQGTSKMVTGKGKGKGQKRDDDTHYFDSYASNDIHEIMLKDTIRTVTYGRFILDNPKIFKDAIVMDVGCGTGILSMFAAKAGAKKVYAIEASGLATKARENIKRNGMQDVIEIVQGKVEEVQIPVEKQVDVIISEWMGYMLLYESMLDSVVFARDKYLKPDGLMAPSQTRIVIAGATGARLNAEGFAFWDNVYGFDLSAMKPSKVSEGIVDLVPAEEIVTSTAIIKDINTHKASVDSLDFVSDFSISPSASTVIGAFVTWFDTFFTTDSSVTGQATPDEDVELHQLSNREISKDVVASEERSGVLASFTTGPQGQPTHWKQVTFKLSEAVQISAGQTIRGSFHCRKAKGNSRELDIEIHWEVEGDGSAHNQRRYGVYQVC